MIIAKGQTAQIPYTYGGSSRDISWKSSSTSIATVSGGSVTGGQTPGTITATATNSLNGKTATIKIIVGEITLSGDSSVEEGLSILVNKTIKPTEIENNKVKELETIIKKSDRQLVDILRKILNIQVDKIIIEKRLKLKNISEYEFEVIKTKAKLENDNEVEIYFKPIKNSRIKESIFCYWCLIYEEEISDKKIHPEGDIFLNKVLISELTKKKYYQSVFLEIENNKGHMLENGTEINFIEILKYLKEESCEGCEELKNYFEKMQDYVLLAGIKINRKNKIL